MAGNSNQKIESDQVFPPPDWVSREGSLENSMMNVALDAIKAFPSKISNQELISEEPVFIVIPIMMPMHDDHHGGDL